MGKYLVGNLVSRLCPTQHFISYGDGTAMKKPGIEPTIPGLIGVLLKALNHGGFLRE